MRIAVAQDEAFCFTYAETLESLQAAGAELCYFSPLRDAALPQHIGGLYLPGGYPELYAAQLAANTAMRCAINTAVQRGLPTVAECGGFCTWAKRWKMTPEPPTPWRVCCRGGVPRGAAGALWLCRAHPAGGQHALPRRAGARA